MKSILKRSMLLIAILTGFSFYAQNRSLDNYRDPDQRGVNVFEPAKDTVSTYDGVKVRLGGASTLQFQALSQENSNSDITLTDLGSNFNLATANLDLDVALYDGVRMHLRTYLSSQHHTEAYVKGGYIQIDKLDFISEGFAEDLMKYVRIKIGHMENNYGDGHFRRSDNAMALHNPFVGNYIMDAFTTEVGAEVYYLNKGWLGMLGLTNGKLNQNVTDKDQTSPSFLAKFGYDKQVNDDFRFRLTGSLFHSAHNNARGIYLYSGDRAGSRYYTVMNGKDINGDAVGDSFRAGRINPDLKNEMTAFMINPFLKYKGLEFFGIIESAKGKKVSETNDRTWNQVSGELLYRFGNKENLYLGTRYNTVNGELASGDDVTVNRFQLTAGWFMTKNILMKAEYVNQEYNDYPNSDIHYEGKFNGLVLEAAISF
ncbi:hypothetical protein [Snuella sedimenti]|uniref:Porin n=1 Tax=Snuella sedimenti TaxID=2798802 RepID=A0A8J7LTU8_9FLAO|nr:hypothetical protein [Snuella sedimenti]MBJ6368766.1 hypothetical protein [Snuella sedimenti]